MKTPVLDGKTIPEPLRTEFPEALWKMIRGVVSSAEKIPEKIPDATAKIFGYRYKKQPKWKKFMNDHPMIIGTAGLATGVSMAYLKLARRKRSR